MSIQQFPNLVLAIGWWMDASTLRAAWDSLFLFYLLHFSCCNYTFFLFLSSISLFKLPFKWYHLSLHLSESIHFIPLWSLVFCLILAVAQDYGQSSAFGRSRQLLSFTQVTFLNLSPAYHLNLGSVPAVPACLLRFSLKGHGLGELG